MNSFGRIFRVTIFGESHGTLVGIAIDGCPPGISIDANDFITDLERRQGGLQKGTTPRKEDDIPKFATGVFNGYTTGAPITILFENNNIRSTDYEKQRDIPRPGHADFVASKKFRGYEDFRGGGHFSGRLTVCLVGAGVIAKKLLGSMRISAKVIEVAGTADIEAGIARAIEAKDSVGGIVECTVQGLSLGIGEPFFDSLESLLAHAVFSIPAIKGIEFGDGFQSARMFGSDNNDAIINDSGQTSTNHAGGVVGGITNGNDLVFRVAVKPTSSTPKPQQSWSRETNLIEEFSIKGRHDLCIALRVPPVLEAVTAIVLADAMMVEKKTF